MEKLVKTRNALLVQVQGELLAAKNLAGRQATVGEAQTQFVQLQELAGTFRRTQTAIEEDQEDEEGIETELNHREEFNVYYYEAKNIIERYITSNTTIKSERKADESNSDGLREAMRLLRATLRVVTEEKLVNGVTSGTFTGLENEPTDGALASGDRVSSAVQDPVSSVSSTDVKEEVENHWDHDQPETQPSNANVISEAEVPVEAPERAFASSTPCTLESEIDGNLLPSPKIDFSETNTPSRNSRGQEEVLKLLQLTPSAQAASVLKRNMDERFIARPPVGDSKQSQETDIDKLNIGTANELTAPRKDVKIGDLTKTCGIRHTPCLMYRWETCYTRIGAMEVGGIHDEAWGQWQQVRNGEQVEEVRKHTGFPQSETVRSSQESVVFRIPLKRKDRWQLMHGTTSELWIRWRTRSGIILQSRMIGNGDKDESGSRPGFGRGISGEVNLMGAVSCDKFRGSKWVEAVVPQGGGVCSGGQPCSPQ